MTTAKLAQLWKNDYFKTAITVIVMVTIILGFWYGSQLLLNTQHPALAVASGSMCNLPGSNCDGWTHPFETTLHVGDLIIVYGANPTEIKAQPYPNGDIIVFRKPNSLEELIVHRAVEKATNTVDGKVYFKTKGDGNSVNDSHSGIGTWNGMISEDLVIGKVILRIPWLGHISLFMRNSSGIFVIVILVIVIVIVEFVIPSSKSKPAETEQKENVQKASET